VAAIALPLEAQSGGSVRVRDTVVVRRIGPAPIPLDSIRTLVRALDRFDYGTENWVIISRQIDSLMKPLMLRASRNVEVAPKGWIGLIAQGPRREDVDSSGQRVTYFAYPLIVSVDPESPAGRAGIAAGDRLIAYDGVDVINHEFNITRMLVPERKLDVTVRREGERKDFTLVVARTPERVFFRKLQPGEVLPAMPSRMKVGVGAIARGPMLPGNVYIISRDGVFGATMSPVTPDLARALNLSTGVLVNEAPETSPAFASGLRTGDVIVNVGSHPVASMKELQAIVQAYMGARDVPLTIVRDHRTREISVKW
jgi:S1-C subfamily serine protease